MTKHRKGTLRKIVARWTVTNVYSRPGEGSAMMELECGHIKCCKLSKEPRYSAYCTECKDKRKHWIGGEVG